MKIVDDSYKQSGGMGFYHEYNKGTESFYKRGYYYHPEGIVDVYADMHNASNFINLSFVYKGRLYSRKIWGSRSIGDKALSHRGNQFVKSILKIK